MNADHDFDLSIPDPRATILSGPARVGAELRAVREQFGWKLPDVAAHLKIRRVFLEAIESGNLSALPAPAYAAGFIRSYAEAMGLDPEEILRRFRAEGLSRPRQPALSFPEPVPNRAVPPGAIIFLVAAVAIGGYFLWYRHSEHELKMAQMVPTVPAKLAPLAVPKSAPPPATATTASPPTTTTTTASSSTATTDVPAPAVSTDTGTTANTSAATANQSASTAAAPGSAETAPTSGSNTDTGNTQTASAATPPATTSVPATSSDSTTATASQPPASTAGNAATAPAATAASTSKGPLVVTATATSWVQVKDAKGTILFSRVLKAGQSWPVPDEPGLTLTTGNAGGTVLVHKGVAAAPLGKNGVVLHDVPLTPPAGNAGTNPPAGAAAQ